MQQNVAKYNKRREMLEMKQGNKHVSLLYFLRKYAEMSTFFGIQGLLGTVLALFMGRDKIGWKKVMK